MESYIVMNRGGLAVNTSSQYLYNDLRKMVRWAREFMPHGILLEKGGTQR